MAHTVSSLSFSVAQISFRSSGGKEVGGGEACGIFQTNTKYWTEINTILWTGFCAAGISV